MAVQLMTAMVEAVNGDGTNDSHCGEINLTHDNHGGGFQWHCDLRQPWW